MKKRTIKVADASGSRRHEDVLVIERKNTPQLGETVTVVFVDEYSRNGCVKADRADYTVEGVKFETPYKAERGIYNVWLKKVLNAGQRPGDGQLCVPCPAGGARNSAFDLEGRSCAK